MIKLISDKTCDNELCANCKILTVANRLKNLNI